MYVSYGLTSFPSDFYFLQNENALFVLRLSTLDVETVDIEHLLFYIIMVRSPSSLCGYLLTQLLTLCKACS